MLPLGCLASHFRLELQHDTSSYFASIKHFAVLVDFIDHSFGQDGLCIRQYFTIFMNRRSNTRGPFL